jgi:hypothetical protein
MQIDIIIWELASTVDLERAVTILQTVDTTNRELSM